jgi:hypothetical protein
MNSPLPETPISGSKNIKRMPGLCFATMRALVAAEVAVMNLA